MSPKRNELHNTYIVFWLDLSYNTFIEYLKFKCQIFCIFDLTIYMWNIWFFLLCYIGCTYQQFSYQLSVKVFRDKLRTIIMFGIVIIKAFLVIDQNTIFAIKHSLVHDEGTPLYEVLTPYINRNIRYLNNTFFIFWMLIFESSKADALTTLFFQWPTTPMNMSFLQYIPTIFNRICTKLHQTWNVKGRQIKETRGHQRTVRCFSQKNTFPVITKLINEAALALMTYQTTIHMIYL